MKYFLAIALLSKLAVFSTAQDSGDQGRDNPERVAAERNEEPGSPGRRGEYEKPFSLIDVSLSDSAKEDEEIIASLVRLLGGRVFGESEESRESGEHRGTSWHRSRGRHRGHGKGKPVIMIPLYKECQNFTSSMKTMFKEMWTNQEIGPARCQGDFGECIKNDMQRVRCRVSATPSAECIAKVTQYMQGSSCTNGGGNGNSGGGTGAGTGGGNRGTGRNGGESENDP